jgi:uncharacterized protein YbjQ (UPF0145 family)
MLIATTDTIADRPTEKVLGFVQGSSIRARHLGTDLLASFKNITGGEITGYTKLMAEAREQCLDRMREQATSMGANAIVGVRFVTTEVMQGAAELVAYGTAVILADE